MQTVSINHVTAIATSSIALQTMAEMVHSWQRSVTALVLRVGELGDSWSTSGIALIADVIY